jgi:hypothetical protein
MAREILIGNLKEGSAEALAALEGGKLGREERAADSERLGGQPADGFLQKGFVLNGVPVDGADRNLPPKTAGFTRRSAVPAEKQWFRLAQSPPVSPASATQETEAVFLVSNGRLNSAAARRQFGILRALTQVAASGNRGFLFWEANSHYDPGDFALAFTPGGPGSVFELWARIPSSDFMCTATVLQEARRATGGSIAGTPHEWQVNSAAALGDFERRPELAQEAPTPGFTRVASEWNRGRLAPSRAGLAPPGGGEAFATIEEMARALPADIYSLSSLIGYADRPVDSPSGCLLEVWKNDAGSAVRVELSVNLSNRRFTRYFGSQNTPWQEYAFIAG